MQCLSDRLCTFALKAASITLKCFVVELAVVCTVSSFAYTLEV